MRSRYLPLLGVLFLGSAGLLVGCGSDSGPADTSNATTVPASTLPPSAGTSLTITVGTDDEPVIKKATLTVDEAGAATGTGFLQPPERAAAAAALLENPAVVKRLTEGVPQGQMCTEIYGGPDRATVEGTLNGAAVSQQFHRSDGCGIADWELFLPMLGR